VRGKARSTLAPGRLVEPRQAFAAEQPRLLALPATGYALGQRLEVSVAKTPYVRFDWNDYTVPHTHVQRTLSVLADEQRVRIFGGIIELANHPRSFDRHQVVEDPTHLQALLEYKRRARAHRGCDALAQVVPASTELLQMAAQRYNLGSTPPRCCPLDQYGAQSPQSAILTIAAMCPIPTPCVSRWSMRASGRPPPLALALPSTWRDATRRCDAFRVLDRRYDPPKTGR
jgi:hypothetical protein